MILADPPPPRRSGLATWGLGLTGSVLANLALALTVLLSLQPQPVPDQDRPETTLDMTAQSLPRSEAVPSPAEGEAAPAFHPIPEMKKALFESFAAQISRAAEAKDTRKRDVLARIYGPEPIDPAALAAGLHYNLDLILGLSPRVPVK